MEKSAATVGIVSGKEMKKRYTRNVIVKYQVFILAINR